MKPFEHKGFWCTPQNPSAEVYGILTHDGRGKVTLALAGQLGKFDEQIEVINGVTISGEHVTLCDSFPVKGEHTSLSQPREIHTLHINRVFVGHHFVKVEDIKFNKVVVHFEGLFEWSPFRGASGDVQSVDGKRTGISASVDFEDALRIDINDIRISLHHLTGQNWSFKGLEISNDAAFHIEYPQPTHWSQISHTVGVLQHLLTFSLQIAIRATRIEGFNEEIKETLGVKEITGEVTRSKPIAIIYPQSGREKETSHFYLKDAIITLRRGTLDFPSLIGKWFEFDEKCSGSQIAFLSTYYATRMPPDEKFSTLCTAIEAFHRETVGGQIYPENEFNELLDTITQATTDSNKRNFVQEKMRYANEPRLRQRLKETLAGLEALIRFQDRARFIDRTVKTRNYFAHMDSESDKGILDGIKVYHYSELLNMIMQMLILKWLGCDDVTITGVLQNRQNYFLRKALKDDLDILLPENNINEEQPNNA